MADISVTITSPPSVEATIGPRDTFQATIGSGLVPHASSHAPGGSDSLESYYYPRSNPSGYISSGDFASQAYVTGVSGYLQGQINDIGDTHNLVYLTGNQNISGEKNFYTRPTVNGTGVLLSGEITQAETGYLTGYVLKTETGVFVSQSEFNSQSGYWISGYNDSITGISITGSGVKTVTLYQRDGSTLSANFTDNEGAGADYYLTGAAFNSSNGDLSLYVSNGSIVVQSLDGRYVTGSVVRPSETGSFATTGYVTGASGFLQTQITTLTSQTGNYALKSQTGAFLTTGAGDNRYVLQSATGAYTGVFYPRNSNPSGYLVAADLASYATQSYVTGVSGHLQSGINGINAQSGQWITGYNDSLTGITVVGTIEKTITLYQRDGGTLTATFQDIQRSGDGVGGTGGPYLLYDRWAHNGNGSTSGFSIAGATADNEMGYRVTFDGVLQDPNNYLISGETITFYSPPPDGVDVIVVGQNITGGAGGVSEGFVTGISGYLQGQISAIDVSNYVLKSETGQFYPTSNPSGYITGVDLSSYATTGYVTGASGYLQDQITNISNTTGQFVTGSVVRPSQTGQFVPYTGALADINLGENSLLTHGISGNASHGLNIGSNNGTTCVTIGVGGGANSTFYGGLKGDYATASKVAIFDASKNIVSANVTTGELNCLTGVTSSIQSQIDSIRTTSGAFLTTGAGDLRYYPLSSNPSSYLVAADIANLASTGYVTGVSGYLQGQINTLNTFTGQANSGYNDSITGLSFSGSDTKTLYLYQQDGGVISGSFVDLQGTGGSSSNAVLLTGDQNISGVKNFISRPTFNGSGLAITGSTKVAQVVYTQDATQKVSTAVIPTDNTIPQSGEGTAYTELDATITPTNASSRLLVEVQCACWTASANRAPLVCVFRDSGADALAVGHVAMPTATFSNITSVRLVADANSTDATTFKVRFGVTAAGATVYLNDYASTPYWGGTFFSSMTITEILP